MTNSAKSLIINDVDNKKAKKLISAFKEYELIKLNKHSNIFKIKDLLAKYSIKSHIFYKYYNRYIKNKNINNLIPQKRGPKINHKKIPQTVVELIIKERKKGLNKYKIKALLDSNCDISSPSISFIYNIYRKAGLGSLSQVRRDRNFLARKQKFFNKNSDYAKI